MTASGRAPAARVPIQRAFDILPIRGVLPAGQSEIVEFSYFAFPNQKMTGTALCEIEGGPTYEMPFSAESNAIR